MNDPEQTVQAAVLNTDRLRLRPMRIDDSEAFLDVYGDRETMLWWSREPCKNLPAAAAMVQADVDAMNKGGSLFWAMTLQGQNRAIGKCTLFKIDKDNLRAEIGFILNRQHWRKGLMFEAAQAVVNHAFSDLGLHRLEADADPQNQASLALLEKLGFQKEGLARHRWQVGGKWSDSVMLGLLSDDWAQSTR